MLLLTAAVDEMYQIVVHMPEDIDFICRVCCGSHPSRWQLMVKEEMHNGMFSVLDALMASKSIKRLLPVATQTQVSIKFYLLHSCLFWRYLNVFVELLMLQPRFSRLRQALLCGDCCMTILLFFKTHIYQ